MKDTEHFGEFSIVSGHIKINLGLSRFEEQFRKAQLALGYQVLADCKIYMPHLNGILQQRSYVEDDGNRVVFPGPYARFLYGGKVMVEEKSRSAWARRDERKVVTDKPLTYSAPNATAEWFQTAKNNHGQDWIALVKRIGGGGDG